MPPGAGCGHIGCERSRAGHHDRMPSRHGRARKRDLRQEMAWRRLRREQNSQAAGLPDRALPGDGTPAYWPASSRSNASSSSSASVPTTISARRSLCAERTPIARMPPRWAPSIPAGASSTTMQRARGWRGHACGRQQEHLRVGLAVLHILGTGDRIEEWPDLECRESRRHSGAARPRQSPGASRRPGAAAASVRRLAAARHPGRALARGSAALWQRRSAHNLVLGQAGAEPATQDGVVALANDATNCA